MSIPTEPTPTTAVAGAGMTGKVARGLKWSMVDVGLQQLVRFAITVVLTRLIAPEDFGVIAMALVFTALASLVGDLGLGPAIVQRATVERRHIVTATNATFLVGLLLAGVLAALAWPIAALYGEPELQNVLLVLSLTYVFRGIAGVPRETMRRAMRFDLFVLSSAVAVVISGVIGLVLAFADYGVWALVAQVLFESLLGAVMAVALSWKFGYWKPGFGFDRAALKELAGFGVFVSGTRLANYGAQNVDNFIVGKVLGSSALGLYNLAYRLMLFPILKVADVVANVTMPALSTMQGDLPRIASAYRRTIQAIGVVCFPVSIGTMAAAPVLVPAVFGSAWLPAVPVVQILAINGIRMCIGRLNGTVYQAVGKPKWDFFVVAATFVGYVVAFIVGVQFGIAGVAWGFTIVGYLIVPVEQYLLHRVLRARVRDLLRVLVPVAAASLIMGACTWLAVLLTDSWSSDGLRALTAIAVAGAVYLVGLRLLEPKLLGQLRTNVLRR